MLKITNDMNEILESSNAVVAFTADWCNPCTKIKPQFAKVSMQKEDYDFFVVDVDKIASLHIDRYGIKSIPRILVMEKGVVRSDIKSKTAPEMLEEINAA